VVLEGSVRSTSLLTRHMRGAIEAERDRRRQRRVWGAGRTPAQRASARRAFRSMIASDRHPQRERAADEAQVAVGEQVLGVAVGVGHVLAAEHPR
jgi:hypothetical protein